MSAPASSARTTETNARARNAIRAFFAREREAQTRFLAEPVKAPSDNPPGDCAPHAARAAGLLEALDFAIERHSVPDELVRANGMISCTNLVARVRFGEGGPTIALNARGDVVRPGGGWSCDPCGAAVRESARRMAGIRVEVRRILLAQPFVKRPGHEHRVHAIARSAREVFGPEIGPHGVPIYTDARHYSEAGIPTVLYGAGPRTLEQANAHRADEKLKLDDLYKATEAIALSLLDLLGAGN